MQAHVIVQGNWKKERVMRTRGLDLSTPIFHLSAVYGSPQVQDLKFEVLQFPA